MKNKAGLFTLITIAAWLLLPDPVFADNCGSLSDCYNTLRAALAATVGVGLFAALLSLGLDFIPGVGTVKGIVEAFTGRDLITGQELAWWERVLGVVPLGGALVGGAVGLSRAARHAGDVADATSDLARAADGVSDAARTTDRVGEAADAAGDVSRTGRAADEASDAARAGERTGEAADTAADATRAERLDELAQDPAHGGKITPKTRHEAEVGLELEGSGKLPGPIQRDPSGAAEFIDANGEAWDMKSFNSNFPPKKGGFDLNRDVGKIASELDKGENVILDTTNLSAEHAQQLRDAVAANGWTDRILWYP